MNVEMDYLFEDDSGVWFYRRRFLKDIRPFVPKVGLAGWGRELFKRSLHTKDMKAPGALERYTAARLEYEEIVAKAEKLKRASDKRAARQFDELNSTDIATLADRYHAQELRDDADRRKNSEAKAAAQQVTGMMRQAGFELPIVPDAAEWTLSIREAHETIRDAARSARAMGDIEGIIDYWGNKALSLASERGFELEHSGRSHIALCEALHDAAVRASEDALRRLDGDLVPTPPMPELPKASTAKAPKVRGLRLTELFELYASVPGRNPKTMGQWRPYIEHLAKFAEVDEVSAITHEHIVAWRNHLRDEVTYRGNRLSAKTINGSYLGAVNALFAWAKGDNKIRQNPALEVTPVKLPAKPKTRGKALTNEEAKTILRASLVPSVSREGEHLQFAKRWCPWLMAYSGARVNEITQLRKEDIFKQDDVWVMRITPDAGTVKTKTFRLVPLHSHLLDQGFREFVDSRPDGPLFYNPSRRRSEDAINTQAKVMGTKLAAWVGSLGVKGVKPNHGWRHLFSNLAVRHGLDRVVAKAITGHASSDVHDKTYLEDLPNHVDVLARELEKMPNFAVDGV